MAVPSGDCVINEFQQVQLRAQILVYGALLQGSLPEEPLMVGAFSDTSLQEPSWNDGRHLWEKSWLAAKESGEPESELPAAPAPVQRMPTATRSALTIQPQSSTIQAGEGDDAEDDPEAREKKRTKLSSDKDQAEELEENLQKQEVEVLQVKHYVDDVDLVSSSILEHSRSLRVLLQGRSFDHARMASLRVALEAAYSASNAAAAATRAAYESALQAQRTSLDISEGVTSQDEEPECEDVSRALGSVFKAVSQAQTALEIGSSSSKKSGEAGKIEAQETLLSEGATVEVMSRRPGVWLTAKVLSVKDGAAHILYTELVEDGKNHVAEWVSSGLKSCQPPRIRLPYPTFDLNEKLDDEPKRWTVGDHIDARVENSWREGIIVCVKNDEVEVFYPGEGLVESVKASNIRPSLLWQGDKWVLWKCLYVEAEAHQNNNIINNISNNDINNISNNNNIIDINNKKEAASSSPEVVAELGETGPLPNHKMRKLVDVILEETEALRKRDEKQQQQQQRIKKQMPATKVSKAKQLIERATRSNSSLQSKLAMAKGHHMLRQFVKLKSSPGPRKAKQQRRN